MGIEKCHTSGEGGGEPRRRTRAGRDIGRAMRAGQESERQMGPALPPVGPARAGAGGRVRAVAPWPDSPPVCMIVGNLPPFASVEDLLDDLHADD